jgi:hypothetical protein
MPVRQRDPKRVVSHLVAVVEESARRVRQDPTTDLESNAAAICRSRYFADQNQVREVLLRALSTGVEFDVTCEVTPPRRTSQILSRGSAEPSCL